MAILASICSAITSLGVLLWSFKRFEQVETAMIRPTETVFDDSKLRYELEAQAESIERLQNTAKDQNVAISEGIERTDRAERRVRATVARAKKRLDDAGYSDEGIQAEIQEFDQADGFGGRESPVQPLPNGLAESPQHDMSAFPGRW